jgi:hypothetical protein
MFMKKILKRLIEPTVRGILAEAMAAKTPNDEPLPVIARRISPEDKVRETLFRIRNTQLFLERSDLSHRSYRLQVLLAQAFEDISTELEKVVSERNALLKGQDTGLGS